MFGLGGSVENIALLQQRPTMDAILNSQYKHMEQHTNLSDKEFEVQFAGTSLDPAIFTHEAHLRLAWIHIAKYGEKTAIINITGQLKKFVQRIGATDKYNETLTVAAIKTVNHFMQKQPLQTFTELITTNPRLTTNFKDIVAQHYSFDMLQSAKAKQKYLEPDLLEFT